MKKALAVITTVLIISAMAFALVACNDETDKEIQATLSEEVAMKILDNIDNKAFLPSGNMNVGFTQNDNGEVSKAEIQYKMLDFTDNKIFKSDSILAKTTKNSTVSVDYYGYAIDRYSEGGEALPTKNPVHINKTYAAGETEPETGELITDDFNLTSAQRVSGFTLPKTALETDGVVKDVINGDLTDFQLTGVDVSTKNGGYKYSKLTLEVSYTDDEDLQHTLKAEIKAVKIDENGNYRISALNIENTANGYSYSLKAEFSYPETAYATPDYTFWGAE